MIPLSLDQACACHLSESFVLDMSEFSASLNLDNPSGCLLFLRASFSPRHFNLSFVWHCLLIWLALVILEFDSAFLVDSSGAWDLTHTGLRTNFFPYFFTLLLSSIPCSFQFLTHPAVPPVVSYALQFSTLFTSQLPSTIYSSSHLYCLHLSNVLGALSTSSYCSIIVLCLFVRVCVFQCAAPPRCTRWHPPLLFARCLPCLCWWPTTESSHRPCCRRPPGRPTVLNHLPRENRHPAGTQS